MTPTGRQALSTNLWAAALLIVGSLSLAQAWASLVPTALLAAAAVGPMLLLRGVVRLGVSRWAAASVLTLLLVLLAYLLSARADTTFSSTVSDALPLLLSEPQPLVVRPDLLAAPVLAAGMTGILVGLRLSGATRVAPVAGAAVLYAAGLLLTAGSGDPHGLLAGLLLVLALGGWALLDEHTEPTSRRTQVLAPVAALGVAVAAMSAVVPVSHAFDPRDLVSAPIETVETTNPLPQLGAWAANPKLELLRVTGPSVPLRLVTLDEYDGVQWSSATRFAAFGTGGEPALPAGKRQEELTHHVDVLKLAVPWLPSAGQPTSIDARDALLDSGTGSIHLDEHGDDFSYSVTARQDAPERESLPSATVPMSSRLDRFLEVPDLTFALAEYSQAATDGAATPYERALAIEAAVRGDRKFSAKAISGSAYWRIERFLLGKLGSPGAQVGSSEQFATAFAVIARQNGLPTRIVVGFRPGDENSDGSRTIHGEDALAWPEVYFQDLGWVPFSPLPEDSTFAHADVDSTPLASAPPEPTKSVESAPAPSVEPHDAAATEKTTEKTADDDSTWLFTLPVLLVVAPLVILWIPRRLRTLRHRRSGARGAWAETLDVLTIIGAPVRSHESATDVARRLQGQLGDQVLEVATAAESVAFGPDPGSGSWPSAIDSVRRSARRSLPAWRRGWWWFDPRPLLRSRRT